MLQHEVPVEQNRLDLGEERVVAVEVRPARLHHADRGVGKVVDDLHQPIRLRREVGVEDGDELAGRGIQAVVERSRLVALAIGAMDINDVVAQRRIAFNHAACHVDRLVSRIVEHLDLQPLARILHLADAIDQAVNDVLFVEDRQLDGDLRQLLEMRFRIGDSILAMLVIEIDELIAVHSVRGQEDQDNEVRNEQRRIEGVGLIQPLEGRIEKMRLQVMAQAMRLGHNISQQAEGRVQKNAP